VLASRFRAAAPRAVNVTVCNPAKLEHTIVTVRLAPPLRTRPYGGNRKMLMFKRSQIYIGLGLAAVVELVIRFAH
jgi:hypothetical protein